MVLYCIALWCSLSRKQSNARLIEFLRNPIVVFLNIITLIATLYHTVTYFLMTPKVMNIIVKNERLPHTVVRNALWAVTALVSVIALVLVYI